jgi:hypothetical protein
MKRRVTVTEGKPHQIGALRIDVRRKPRHKRQFVVMVEIAGEAVALALAAAVAQNKNSP